MTEGDDVDRRKQVSALFKVAGYRPTLTAGIVLGGVFAALLEGVGLSFIIPIVELVQASGDPAEQAGGLMSVFVRAYDLLGFPLTLGSVVVGVSVIMTIRWTTTFLVRWFQSALVIDYTRELQTRAFDSALDAKIEYFDRQGSDDILNAIVTQAEYAGRAIRYFVSLVEQASLSVVYLAVAFLVSPLLTTIAVVFMGGIAYIFRNVLESGYDIGDRVADANERVQQTAQAGTQGIRDTKMYGLKPELFDDFLNAVGQYTRAMIRLRRNEKAISSFYNLLTAISVFVLIYAALVFADLSLGALGIFLFAMFRLGPKASQVNSLFYRVENNLPHLIRTQSFTDELDRNREPVEDSQPVPSEVLDVSFDDVRFAYAEQEDDAVRGISFSVQKGEFVGFVGQSGAGKSTIASLLARLYEPDAGEIRANGRPIRQMDIDEWRSKIALVRQDPFIFNETLRYNLTVGNRDASTSEIDSVCRTAMVTEFLDDLPDGYDTKLGDDGVRLSGGQRQRVALARALLKDADLLVLDEATSDLDSNLEQEVQAAIESMERDYAIITIAHRLSTVQNADRIYTIEDGAIAEVGDHEELIDKGGTYAEFYSIQTSGT